MFLCVCFSVNEQKLKVLVEQGKCLAEILEETQATTNCGLCESLIKEFVDSCSKPSIVE